MQILLKKLLKWLLSWFNELSVELPSQVIDDLGFEDDLIQHYLEPRAKYFQVVPDSIIQDWAE